MASRRLNMRNVLKTYVDFVNQLYAFIDIFFLFNKTNRRTNFSKFIFVKKFYMFRAVPLPIIRSSPL